MRGRSLDAKEVLLDTWVVFREGSICFGDSIFRGRAKMRRCTETPKWRYLVVSEYLFSWSAGRKGERVLTLSMVKKSQECDLRFVRE